jgi:hypothetical protein
MSERKQMSVDMATIAQADRCAALLTLRMGGKVTRIGAVRVALGELADKLEEQQAASGQEGGTGG